ncbi:MAG: hypothetical protein ACXW3O_01700 [Brevundimonas sp.]
MFKALKCRLTGHVFVDSRSQPGIQVCARCRHRQAFEGLKATPAAPRTDPAAEANWRRLPGDPTPS